MNRIETALQALQEKKEKAFITYITAGLPDYDKTKAIIKAQEAAGTDIIELGIPFSDPVADGPVIQAASYEAILGGANLEKTFICHHPGYRHSLRQNAPHQKHLPPRQSPHPG